MAASQALLSEMTVQVNANEKSCSKMSSGTALSP